LFISPDNEKVSDGVSLSGGQIGQGTCSQQQQQQQQQDHAVESFRQSYLSSGKINLMHFNV